MCLSEVCDKKETKEIIRGLPKDLKFWRVVNKSKGRKYSPLFNYTATPFCEGVNTAKQSWTQYRYYPKKSYRAGFHLFRYKSDAKRYSKNLTYRQSRKLICCRIKKSWITLVGRQYSNGICLVVSKAIFPKYCK